jgi:hypothetical protein
MSQLHKTYDLKTAAGIFGIGDIEFYKTLRGESKRYHLPQSWINCSKFEKDRNKNKPRDWAKKAGYLTIEQRGFPAVYNNRAWQTYEVTVITRLGMMALEKILGVSAGLPPEPLPLNEKTAQAIQAAPRTDAAQQERNRCLDELTAMGLAIKRVN